MQVRFYLTQYTATPGARGLRISTPISDALDADPNAVVDGIVGIRQYKSPREQGSMRPTKSLVLTAVYARDGSSSDVLDGVSGAFRIPEEALDQSIADLNRGRLNKLQGALDTFGMPLTATDYATILDLLNAVVGWIEPGRASLDRGTLATAGLIERPKDNGRGSFSYEFTEESGGTPLSDNANWTRVYPAGTPDNYCDHYVGATYTGCGVSTDSGTEQAVDAAPDQGVDMYVQAFLSKTGAGSAQLIGKYIDIDNRVFLATYGNGSIGHRLVRVVAGSSDDNDVNWPGGAVEWWRLECDTAASNNIRVYLDETTAENAAPSWALEGELTDTTWDAEDTPALRPGGTTFGSSEPWFLHYETGVLGGGSAYSEALIPAASDALGLTPQLAAGYAIGLGPELAHAIGLSPGLAAGYARSLAVDIAHAAGRSAGLTAGYATPLPAAVADAVGVEIGLVAGGEYSVALVPGAAVANGAALDLVVGYVPALSPDQAHAIGRELGLVAGGAYAAALVPGAADALPRALDLVAGYAAAATPGQADADSLAIAGRFGQRWILTPSLAQAAGIDLDFFTGIVLGEIFRTGVRDRSPRHDVADRSAAHTVIDQSTHYTTEILQ